MPSGCRSFTLKTIRASDPYNTICMVSYPTTCSLLSSIPYTNEFALFGRGTYTTGELSPKNYILVDFLHEPHASLLSRRHPIS